MIDAYCRGCFYRGSSYGGSTCDFLYITGHSRGCPPGNGCTRRVIGSGTKKNTPFNRQFLQTPKKKKPINKLSKEERQRRETARKRKATEEYRAKAQGRQRAAIEAYKKEHNLTFVQFAELLGISDGTLQQWVYENYPAKWELLGSFGIQKPEGL